MKRSLAVSLALFLLAGCGGGGSSSVPGAAQTGTPSKAAANGSVVISIPVASTTTQSLNRTVRYPQFVSPGASSVELSVNSGADTNFDVSSTSNLCVTAPGTGLRNCTLSFGAPAGSDTFAFLIFSGTNGTGSQLASATSSQTIVTGTAFNFTVALNAAIGTLLITINSNNNNNTCPAEPFYGTQNIINEGCAGSATVTIAVEDPSGAPISGNAPYATPINFTTNDPTLSASPAQITAPGQTETVSYNGGAFAASITNQAIVSATAGGQGAQTTFPIRRSYLYVASANAQPNAPTLPGGGNVAVYQYGASNATAPVRVISGGATGLNTPVAVQIDAAGYIYVLDNGTAVSASYNPSIEVFAPGATGNATPVRTISNMGVLAVTGQQACSSMVFDPTAAHLFVACGSITIVFPTAANGAASGVFSTEWQDDDAGYANGFAFDPTGDLYLADSQQGVIDIISPPVQSIGAYNGAEDGSHTLNGTPGTGWPGTVVPLSLYADNSGTLYVALSGSPSGELALWNNVPCTNCAPTTTFTGAPFNSGDEAGLTLDPAGNAYLANPVTNVVTEFSRATMTGGSAAGPPVLRTLTVSAGATGAFGMTVGP